MFTVMKIIIILLYTFNDNGNDKESGNDAPLRTGRIMKTDDTGLGRGVSGKMKMDGGFPLFTRKILQVKLIYITFGTTGNSSLFLIAYICLLQLFY